VGFFREWYTEKSSKRKAWVQANQPEKQHRDDSKSREEMQRRKLVRRSHFMTIVSAWIVTVPAAAVLSALLYYLLSHVIRF